ncbi:LOW QUALITY PROTEIN: polyprotein [Phytophthora megakarya]|uniref:Polyprotein n=1 Tax=Phytophthora megakarya TaxID=4795 RepID=A0A225VM15_9STRA|nr:LOW QUALITY PROTEIN: polyprotein [Phytophthora megakarya]
MEGAKVFSILDLARATIRCGCHQRPSSTAFRTNHEIYEWNTAPMGLAGMLGTWTRLMRQLLHTFWFVVVYLDDICLFSRSMTEHIEHLREVCKVLRENRLYAHPDKCDFGQNSVDFLGHTISSRGLQVDARKTRAIAEWPEPTNTKELQRFLGLAGYDQRFIHHFADMVLPLSSLVKKDVEWQWQEPQRHAFKAIKLALQQSPVVRLQDFQKHFIVKTNASHACIGGVLSQIHDDADLPVAFFGKKLGVHELNWPAHEKGLFAIKQAVTRWGHYLHGTRFDVFTDNSACKWFLQHPRVSGRLARWLDFFVAFDFKQHHLPGSQNVVADALSRLSTTPTQPGEDTGASEDSNRVVVCALKFSCAMCATVRVPSTRRSAMHIKLMTIPSRDQGVMFCEKQPVSSQHLVGVAQVLMQMNNTAVEGATTVSSIQLDHATKKKYQKAYAKDPAYKKMWKAKRASNDYELHDGLIYLKSEGNVRRLCVPNCQQLRLDVIHNTHDATIMAHPGIRRTQLAASQAARPAPRKLQPIPLPTACWDVVSTDFIKHLPYSDGFDAITVVVDKLSKCPVYIPTHTTATAEDTTTLFFNNVIRHYGILTTIISDRDPKFTSKFWKALVNMIKIKTTMTTAHRAQADDQTERQNRTLEDSLRCSISYHGNDWNEHLPMIEYAHATLNPFKAGELALLSTQDLNILHTTAETTLRARKFIPRFIGPYRIKDIKGNVTLLELSANLKHLSRRFNIDKLKVYASNPDRFAGHVIPKFTPLIFDDDGEPLNGIEALIKKRVFNRQPEYLVKWHGLPHHENTWERERVV